MTACFYPIRLDEMNPKKFCKFRFMEQINLIYYIDKNKLDDLLKYILTEYCDISMMGYYKHNDKYWCKKYSKYSCDLYIEIQIIKKSFDHTIVRVNPFVGNDTNINNFITSLHESLQVHQASNFIRNCLNICSL